VPLPSELATPKLPESSFLWHFNAADCPPFASSPQNAPLPFTASHKAKLLLKQNAFRSILLKWFLFLQFRWSALIKHAKEATASELNLFYSAICQIIGRPEFDLAGDFFINEVLPIDDVAFSQITVHSCHSAPPHLPVSDQCANCCDPSASPRSFKLQDPKDSLHPETRMEPSAGTYDRLLLQTLHFVEHRLVEGTLNFDSFFKFGCSVLGTQILKSSCCFCSLSPLRFSAS
jgi:hypothetical protein